LIVAVAPHERSHLTTSILFEQTARYNGVSPYCNKYVNVLRYHLEETIN
jgi:hypothetical protein